MKILNEKSRWYIFENAKTGNRVYYYFNYRTHHQKWLHRNINPSCVCRSLKLSSLFTKQALPQQNQMQISAIHFVNNKKRTTNIRTMENLSGMPCLTVTNASIIMTCFQQKFIMIVENSHVSSISHTRGYLSRSCGGGFVGALHYLL